MKAQLRILMMIVPLAGCAVGPDYVRQDPAAPANWSVTAGARTASQQEDISHWWLRLNDPVLDELISTALRNSPDMRSARAKLQASRARLNLSDADFMPRVNGALGGSRSKVGDASPANQFNAGFDASWSWICSAGCAALRKRQKRMPVRHWPICTTRKSPSRRKSRSTMCSCAACSND